MKRKPPDIPNGYSVESNKSIKQEQSRMNVILETSAFVGECGNKTKQNYLDHAVDVSIPKASFQLRQVLTVRGTVEHRIIMELDNGKQSIAYDADFGFAMNCSRLLIHVPGILPHPQFGLNQYYTRLNEPMRILVVRFRQHFIDGKRVSVGPNYKPNFPGNEFEFYTCADDTQYCYGFPSTGNKVDGVTLGKHKDAFVIDKSNPERHTCFKSNVLLLKLAGREFAFEFQPVRYNKLVAAPYTGLVEVHSAFKMVKNEAGLYFQDKNSVVAIKTLKCGEHVKALLTTVRTTADLSAHYAGRGSNENPMHEIRSMHFLSSVTQGTIASRNLINLHHAAADPSNLHLMMSFYPGGSLFHYLLQREKQTHRRLEENVIRVIVRQLSHVLSKLHEVGVAYQDLSVENIIVDNTDLHGTVTEDLSVAQFVLIDMGHIAGHKWDPETETFGLLAGREHCVGKIIYHCPEFYTHFIAEVRQLMTSDPNMTRVEAVSSVVSSSQQLPSQRKPYSGFQVDSWQLGVLMLSLFSGYGPFDETAGPVARLGRLLEWFLDLDSEEGKGLNADHVVRYDVSTVVNGNRIISMERRPLNSIASSLAVDLMQQLLRFDPTDRLTIREVLEHAWLTAVTEDNGSDRTTE